MTRLYTRGGDEGETSLAGGQRVRKDALRVAAYGTVDELNACLGVSLAQGLSPRLAEFLPAIQNELFHLGSDLSFLEADKADRPRPQIRSQAHRPPGTADRRAERGGRPAQEFHPPGRGPGRRPPACGAHGLPAR